MSQKSSLEILSQMFVSGITKEQFEAIKQLPINETNVLEELAKAGHPFTWETVSEHGIDENTGVIEVRLYIPGLILYGRKVYSLGTEEFKTAHISALYEAIKPILGATTTVQQSAPVSVQQPVQQSNPIQPLSNDEIMNIVQQQSAATQDKEEPKKINTAEDWLNDTREEIPFDEVNLSNDELNKLLSGNAQSQPTAPVQQTPQQPALGFTPEQIQKMKEFKQRYNITTDEILGSYINAWNNKLSRKEDLNGSNIDSFLEWTTMLGKAPL
jgi:hypothetical protein